MSPHSAASDRHIPASSDILNEKVLTVLKDVVMRRTSARSLSERLGHSHNYVRRILSGEITLQLETLFDMLQELGLPPRLFFARVFAQLPDTDPAAVLRFYREADARPSDRFLEEIASRVHATVERPTLVTDVESRWDRLDRLEELRFEDRDAAKEGLEAVAKEILDDAEANGGDMPLQYLEELAIALATWASTRRMAGHWNDACDGLTLAFQCSRDRTIRFARGFVYQKSAYVLKDLNAPTAGLEFLDRAAKHFIVAGATTAVAKTYADRAVLAVFLSDHSLAMQQYATALEALPPEEFRYRISALVGLSHCYQEAGRLAEAIHELREARRLYGDKRDITLAHIEWVFATLSAKLDQMGEAEESLRASMQLFAEFGSTADSALVALDLADLYLRQGRLAELQELARKMFEELPPMRSNQIADAAFLEFIRTARWGEITSGLIEQTRAALSKSQERGSVSGASAARLRNDSQL